MIRDKFKLAILASVIAGLLAACGEEAGNAGAPPAAATASEAAAAPEVDAAPAPAPAPAPAVAAADLEAGMLAMQPRLTSSVDGFSKVEARPDFTFFMHPAADKDSQAEFDVSGLSALTLSPVIADLSANPDCAGFDGAGVVKLSWSLDDQAPNEIMVDRNFRQLVNIDIVDASKLKIAVNQGNDSISCDWFTLGFVNVTPK